MNSVIIIVFFAIFAMVQARYAIVREDDISLPSNERISKRSLSQDKPKEESEEIYSNIEENTEAPEKQLLKKRSLSDFYENIDEWQYSIVHERITKNRL